VFSRVPFTVPRCESRSRQIGTGLLAGLRDPEGNESAARYLARLRGEGTG